MNGGAETEAPRPARPLSGGLWTLFSWLRRDEHSSSESLSSVGSDRTVASFAFLAPAPPRCRVSTAQPPPAPTTDSYKKRVRDRNIRRQYDRDLTLHRKYGLFRGDGGYDAFSLPPARKALAETSDRQDRERRATSECYQRCVAHVPGKRRAPPPPITSTSSLTRRQTRKRPAPQPPVKFLNKTKEHSLEQDNTNILIQMNAKPDPHRRPLSSSDVSLGCKSEKYSKKDNNSKDSKPRTEKSFLKQIFENKKRNSAVETAPMKILPNISELDKQAAEIIESCKLRALEQNNNFSDNVTSSKGDMWFCTRCLRKYDSTIVTCLYCLPDKKNMTNDSVLIHKGIKNTPSKDSNNYRKTDSHSSNVASTSKVSGIGIDEKKKLKEMLKEMKDSLPKRPKHDMSYDIIGKKRRDLEIDPSQENNLLSIETPTLRIGTIHNSNKNTSISQPSSSTQSNVTSETVIPEVTSKGVTSDNVILERTSEVVVITQPFVLMGPPSRDDKKINLQRVGDDNIDKIKQSKLLVKGKDESNHSKSIKITLNDDQNGKSDVSVNTDAHEIRNLHAPLKISSLLNPVYIPKNVTEGQTHRNLFFSQVDTKAITVKQIDKETNTSTKSNELPLRSANFLLDVTPKTQLNTTQPKVTTTKETKVKVENQIQRSAAQEERVTKPEAQNQNEKSSIASDQKVSRELVSNVSSTSKTPSPDKPNNINFGKSTDQHSRRRDLINQLEQSIAKGDERAAAEAAIKLAQLKLSCSVLSFSSQIASQNHDNSKMIINNEQKKVTIENKNDDKKLKSSAEEKSPKKEVSVSQTEKPIRLNEVQDSTRNQEVISAITRPERLKNKLVPPTGEIASPKPTSIEPSTSKQTKTENENHLIPIQVWVEDREATRGPVRLQIRRGAVMGELRRQAEVSLGLAARLQRWIVGRALCSDDNTPLASLAGPDLSAPFYLCLVESETNAGSFLPVTLEETVDKSKPRANVQDCGDVYSELVQLEQRALVSNTEPFECCVCIEKCTAGRGVVLRECMHSFCRQCLSDLVRHCEEAAVTCPAMGCPGVLQEREIRALVSTEEYERWLARGLAAAESGTRNSFHCRTRDCTGWALCEPGVRRFPCPVCKCINCVPCQAIHEGETCEQHQAKLEEAAKTSDNTQTDEGTQALLNTLISKGEALLCPECSAVITKKWGCDWVKCSACKTEICWVTRGRRWGPGGRGDTSGGCRCGVDGKRCHPSCGYCH